MNDPYKVLGVSRDASDEEISKVYRNLVKKYHPDLNPGNEEAAKKMSEINAAYEAIKSGEAKYQSYGQSGYGQSGYGQSGYGGYPQGGSGQDSQDGYNPFGDFNFGGFNFGGYGVDFDAQQQNKHPLDAARSYINMGRYADAINALNRTSERNAEWYYYSGLANWGIGNKVTALQHAERAVQLEPDNSDYRRALLRIRNGGDVYRDEGGGFAMPCNGSYCNCLPLFCLCPSFCPCFCGRC